MDFDNKSTVIYPSPMVLFIFDSVIDMQSEQSAGSFQVIWLLMGCFYMEMKMFALQFRHLRVDSNPFHW